jgi:hypothetical protein
MFILFTFLMYFFQSDLYAGQLMRKYLHSVPKIVALITVRANMGTRTYMGHNSWHMRYDN